MSQAVSSHKPTMSSYNMVSQLLPSALLGLALGGGQWGADQLHRLSTSPGGWFCIPPCMQTRLGCGLLSLLVQDQLRPEDLSLNSLRGK